ncbi:MAG: Xaa-Pro peptidase family protein [Peptococcaceae bacterium]|nr:Xaa-Pro peptidase family protein [Peptococcaceae bacterium]
MKYTPKEELDRRIAGLQSLLRRSGIEGAVIVQNADLFYFAGTIQRSHLFLPADGKPVLMVKKSFPRAREESALEEVIPLEKLKDLPAVIGAYGHKNMNTVGFELDVLPAALYLKYQELFAPARIADIGQLIRTVRMVKSPYEIDLLRGAARLNQAMFSRVRDFLREGITEVELAGNLEAVYRRHGHQGYVRMRGFNQEMAYGHLMSGASLAVPSFLESPEGGPGLNPSFPQGAGMKKIARDEPVMVDYVGVYEGYMVDQTRIFCLGRLADKFVSAYETAVRIQEEIKRRARPGVSCQELYHCAVKMASESGLKDHFMGYPDPVPFVGHGLGIELDELPVLARGFEIPLEEGMVFALEPKFVFPEGEVGIENTFVVREGGLETLTVFDENILYV